MIISAQVLLVIGSVIVISPPILSAKAKSKQNHAACPPFPYIALDHGKITPIGTQKYLFRCDPGYYLASPGEVRCWKGKWTSTKEPKCLKAEGQCEDPDPLTGGEILGEQRHEGAAIQYMCKPGFILMGEGTRTCLRGGHWSGITPTCMEKLSNEMSEMAVESFRRGGMASPTGKQDISDKEAWKISNSGSEPCSSKFANSHAEKTSSPQLTNTTLKKMSQPPALNTNDGSKPPASFERWCVDSYAKFRTHMCVYYCFFLSIASIVFPSIVAYIVAFVQILWSVFRRSMSIVGNLLWVRMRHAASFIRRKQNIQQPVRTSLRLPSTDWFSLGNRQQSTFGRARAIQELEELQFSLLRLQLGLMLLKLKLRKN